MYENITYEELVKRMMDRALASNKNLDSREGSTLWLAEAPAAVELQNLYIALDNILQETFADTASRDYLILRARERGLSPLKRWEKMLGIFPKGTDTLETRRARIKTKLNNFAPYSFRVLVQMLTSIANGSPFEVTLDPGTYLLKITAHWGDEGKIESLAYLVKYIVPCNIAVSSANQLLCVADGLIPITGVSQVVNTFFVTNDSKEKHESAGLLTHRGGVSGSAMVTITNDFNENRSITGSVINGGKPVTAEFIEIKSNEGRFDNG